MSFWQITSGWAKHLYKQMNLYCDAEGVDCAQICAEELAKKEAEEEQDNIPIEDRAALDYDLSTD